MSITDLHVCKNSITSYSSSSLGSFSQPCICPPEYTCVQICGESEYSLSTYISWQHFPRSTSSQSRCDDSEEIIVPTVSDKTTSTQVEEEKESTKTLSSEYSTAKSFSQLNALHYLKIRGIFSLLHFLIGHLVCNEPPDPVQFLVDLLDKCLKYRDSLGEPPLLFTTAHIQSLYKAFDPFEKGHLTIYQYREAMKSLGLENSLIPYNQDPPLNDEDCVDESTFVFEATKCVTENFCRMLRIPKIWEENRLQWKKIMAKKKAKEHKKDSEIVQVEEEEKPKGLHCKCSPDNSRSYCRCHLKSEIKHEPEQLFL